jgi:PKD repeat protein
VESTIQVGTVPPPVAAFTAAPTNGNVPLTVSFTNLSSNATNFLWNFGDGATFTGTNATHTYTNIGSYSVSLTALGLGGSNALSRAGYVQAVDTVPPTITCPTNLIIGTALGQCSAAATYSVMATDNCAVVSLVVMPPSGSVFPKGTNVVTCVATDCGGNSNSCAFTVTVVDGEAPLLVCPTNQVLPCTSTNGAQAFYTPTATDNCDGAVPVTCTPPSGLYFPPGTNTVMCVATDSSGNSNVCSFTITVVETAPELSIMQSGTNMLLSWPQSCSAYTLQATSDFSTPANWVPLSAVAASSNSQWVVTLPLGTNNQFFRLSTR